MNSSVDYHLSLNPAYHPVVKREFETEELAAAAYAVAAPIKSQQQTADICREHLTSAVFEKLNLL